MPTRELCIAMLVLVGLAGGAPAQAQNPLGIGRPATPAEVAGYFLEFRPFTQHCKFADCSHTHESVCGVKQAVDAYGRNGALVVFNYGRHVTRSARLARPRP